ncbi:MAG: hypothetical protein P0Y64_00550 [Candidatus Sphingomonas colombiensis]|nr:hypothetical protein [Sphingomonas sp.]WEK43381.1 MAG: hypothetical protein P0Y64_00550 [Sphingomonas sp.]
MRFFAAILTSAAISVGAAGALCAQDSLAPTASNGASGNPAVKSSNHMTNEPLARGHNSFTEAQAKARIEKAGYSSVTDLVLDKEGLWQARASQAGHSVNVALDYKGNVATR